MVSCSRNSILYESNTCRSKSPPRETLSWIRKPEENKLNTMCLLFQRTLNKSVIYRRKGCKKFCFVVESIYQFSLKVWILELLEYPSLSAISHSDKFFFSDQNAVLWKHLLLKDTIFGNVSLTFPPREHYTQCTQLSYNIIIG